MAFNIQDMCFHKWLNSNNLLNCTHCTGECIPINLPSAACVIDLPSLHSTRDVCNPLHPSPAAPPEAPVNCTLSGSTLLSVTVICDPGASLLPQTYMLNVFQAQTRKVFLNISSPTPKWGLFLRWHFYIFSCFRFLFLCRFLNSCGCSTVKSMTRPKY